MLTLFALKFKVSNKNKFEVDTVCISEAFSIIFDQSNKENPSNISILIFWNEESVSIGTLPSLHLVLINI